MDEGGIGYDCKAKVTPRITYTPSLVVLYRWLLEASEDVHKTKKLGINGNIDVSERHQLPTWAFRASFFDFQPLIFQLPLNGNPPNWE